ncbi:MAG: carbohydrate-binding domain-containing protein [Clostridia bacterium]|nr:carbohydrate-binding domain-containing protein [Clostridia bacterium]
MKRFFIVLLASLLVLSSCGPATVPPTEDTVIGETAEVTDIGFEHVKENIETNLQVICTEGTPNAYTLENGVLSFSGLTADSIYTIKGDLGGHIVVDAGEFKFELVLEGALIQSNSESPIVVTGGDKFTLTAKKDTTNFIYDLREAVDSSLEGVHSGALHVECDMQVGGKGSLTVESQNNNGIHTKDDLEVKNLNLTVTCIDNALKGNDSVSVESGNIVLISRCGDGIKTSNSDVSDKGNQRGDISISGGKIEIYSASDGIDASHDVIVDGAAELNIYTDKFSDYSEEVTAVSESVYYIRYASNQYNFAVKYTNDADESIWKTAKLESGTDMGGMPQETPPVGDQGVPPTVDQGTPPEGFGGGMQGGKQPGGSSRPGKPGSQGQQGAMGFVYEVDKPTGYTKMQVFAYTAGQKPENGEYTVASQVVSVNESYDLIELTENGSSFDVRWTNYSMEQGAGGFPGMGGERPGGGGMGGFEGNSQKSDHSAKGIKAANEIVIKGGNIFIKAYDDGIHANADTVLENGKNPTGNVTVEGGILSIYSNDDAMHADGVLTLSSGDVNITNSYEGIEGNRVVISGGDISVRSSDDGINSQSTSGTGIEIKGGTLYIYASGDGIDSNSRESYKGIVFGGGKTVVISTSGGNSAIDTERGYEYTGGYVLALMPSGGMSSEAKHCRNFDSIAQSTSLRLNSGEYLNIEGILTLKMPTSLNGLVIFIGDKDAKISSSTSSGANVDESGVKWN